MPDYKFSEERLLDEVRKYIDRTYDEYYGRTKIQATEFIIDAGHGKGFCLGNIIKLAKRFGKKEGENRKDILKIIHYGYIMLHVLDEEGREEEDKETFSVEDLMGIEAKGQPLSPRPHSKFHNTSD